MVNDVSVFPITGCMCEAGKLGSLEGDLENIILSLAYTAESFFLKVWFISVASVVDPP